MHSGIESIKVYLLEIVPDALSDDLAIAFKNLVDFSILMHEIASLSKFALVLIIKYLALPSPVQFAVAMSVLRS